MGGLRAPGLLEKRPFVVCEEGEGIVAFTVGHFVGIVQTLNENSSLELSRLQVPSFCLPFRISASCATVAMACKSQSVNIESCRR